MTLRDWFVTVVGIPFFLIVVVGRTLPHIWRMSPDQVPPSPEDWSPVWRSAFRACLRAFPTMVLTATLSLVFLPLHYAPNSGAWAYVNAVCVVFTLLSACLTLVVVVWNRPSYVVPPSLRSSDGLARP